MPPPSLPPTPQTSTEIFGQDNTSAVQLDGSLDLPPPATNTRHGGQQDSKSLAHSGSAASSSARSSASSQSQGSEDSPTIAVKGGRGAGGANQNVSLPPPPTRSRKIIQMTPGSQQGKDDDVPDPAPTTKRATAAKAAANSTAGGRKKQNAGSSAGRKIARKTAHSLIERRRRSKMNEEFATLKDMIPACTGQEMHKLAILQASIDYLRYLEKCITELKAGNVQQSASPLSYHPQAPSKSTTAAHSLTDEDSDEEMIDPDRLSTPVAEEAAAMSRIPSLSSISSSAGFTSPAYSAHSASNWSHSRANEVVLPSPAFEAQSARHTSHRNYSLPSRNSSTPPWHSNNPSPMILPQSQDSERAAKDLDHEASAALLMLNAVDRRTSISNCNYGINKFHRPSEASANSPRGPRGISVKDLLRH